MLDCLIRCLLQRIGATAPSLEPKTSVFDLFGVLIVKLAVTGDHHGGRRSFPWLERRAEGKWAYRWSVEKVVETEPDDGSISLAPLEPEDALRALLAVRSGDDAPNEGADTPIDLAPQGG